MANVETEPRSAILEADTLWQRRRERERERAREREREREEGGSVGSIPALERPSVGNS